MDWPYRITENKIFSKIFANKILGKSLKKYLHLYDDNLIATSESDTLDAKYFNHQDRWNFVQNLWVLLN